MERNRNLDLLKVACSFMVICIHASFLGMPGEVTLALSRIAVPLFFMITGYYYTCTKERNRQGKQLRKIFGLFLGANLLYFLWFLIQNWYEKLPILTELRKQFTLKSIGHFLALNYSFIGGHLWYLGAILYVLLIIWLFEKKWSRRKLYPVVPILFLANLVFGAYAPVIFGHEIHYHYTRNFLFTGLPYFLLGDMLYTFKIELKPKKSLILSLASAGAILAERYLLWKINPDIVQDHLFFSIPCASFVFLFALQQNCSRNNWLIRMLCFIGRNLSTNIYILHLMVISVFYMVMPYVTDLLSPSVVLYYIKPFVIFVSTAALAWGIHRIARAFKKRTVLHTP